MQRCAFFLSFPCMVGMMGCGRRWLWRSRAVQYTIGGAAFHSRAPRTHTWAASCAVQVSALRFLSQKGLCNCDFLVATTAVCTGSSLLSSLLAQGGQQLAAAAAAPEA